MVDINNAEEKIEPMENVDPGAATEPVDLNDISMDKQDSDDIPENDGLELLSDEAMGQPADTAEPAHSEPTEEKGKIALEDQSEEDSLAEGLQELAEKKKLKAAEAPAEEAEQAEQAEEAEN